MEGHAYCGLCVRGVLRRRRLARTVLAVAAVSFGVALAVTLAQLQRRIEVAESTAFVAKRRVARLEDGRGGIVQALELQRAEVRGLREVMATLGRGAEVSRAEREATREAVEDRVDAIERSMAVLLDSLESMRRDIDGGAGPSLTAGEEEALLLRLDDPNPGVRLSALVGLRRGTGAAARKACVKGLGDSQEIVRQQAAVLSRLLGASEAVPALVDCLAEGGPLARESAIDALRTLEGTDLDFDPLGPADGRAEAVARWRRRLEER
jgi:hypothetical protein